MKFLAALFLAVAALSARAGIVTQPIPYEHDGVRLVGYLAYDERQVEKKDRVPGVLVVGEWWGLNDYAKSRAEKIARLGYVVFVADMYGDGQVTTDPKRAAELAGPFYGKPLMAARARAGLEQLLKNNYVDRRRVAAIGYCFGGTVVQALAFSGAPVAGIVSFHGNLLPPSAEAAAATRAKLLICQGAADPFVPPADRDAFLAALDAGKLDYQFVTYAGALHAFTNPKADQIAAATGLKGIGYNAAADRRSWAHLRTFFREIFRSHDSE
jgi:dienelactone hydrolase